MPQWRGDGRELYYRAADGTLWAVALGGDGRHFEVGDRQSLFGGVPILGDHIRTFEPTPDGKRFPVQQRTVGSEPPITVVLNWQTALGR
jgi:hypothetical protein